MKARVRITMTIVVTLGATAREIGCKGGVTVRVTRLGKAGVVSERVGSHLFWHTVGETVWGI